MALTNFLTWTLILLLSFLKQRNVDTQCNYTHNSSVFFHFNDVKQIAWGFLWVPCYGPPHYNLTYPHSALFI